MTRKDYVIRSLIICVVIALGAWNGACTNYNRYNVAEATFSGSCSPWSYAGHSTELLTFLGFEVEQATDGKVTTKWDRWYTDNQTSRAKEHQTRVVVNLKAKTITGQCMTRLIKGPWKFTPCKHWASLEYLNMVVVHLSEELSQ